MPTSWRSEPGLGSPRTGCWGRPTWFIGSPAGFEEKFLALREGLGISSIMVGELGPLDQVVERLAGR